MPAVMEDIQGVTSLLIIKRSRSRNHPFVNFSRSLVTKTPVNERRWPCTSSPPPPPSPISWGSSWQSTATLVDTPNHKPRGKGCAHVQPICQVVDPVTHNHHPGHAEDVLRGRVEMGVGMAVAMVHHLMLGDDHNVWNTSSATPTELLSLQL